MSKLDTSARKPTVRVKTSSCEICLKQFSFLLKQHQCKRCLRAICSVCGCSKSIIANYDLKMVHRICVMCKEEQVQIQDLIQRELLVFNQNSATTRRWIRYIGNSTTEALLEEEYKAELEASKVNMTPQMQNSLKQVPQMVNDFRAQLNYSMFELDFYMTKDIPQTTVAAYVSSVVQCLLHRNSSLQLSQKLISLCLFLLYFHSQPMVYALVNHFRDDLVPARFFDHNNQEPEDSEIDFLVEIGKKNFLIEASELMFLRKYLEGYAYQMLSCMLINHLNATCTYFLFDHLLKFKDFYECEKSVVLLGKFHLNEIKSKGLDKEYLTSYIIKSTRVSLLKEYMCKEDRVRAHSKRDVHSKSDDLFQQFSEKIEQQTDLKNVLQMLNDCILKQMPITNYHHQLISKLHHHQQQIINELLGIRVHKLSQVQEKFEELNEDDTKGDTTSETSFNSKLDLNEQNRLLAEEVRFLKCQLDKEKEQNHKDRWDLEKVMFAQEEIKKHLEDNFTLQESLFKQSDVLFEVDDINQPHIVTLDQCIQTDVISIEVNTQTDINYDQAIQQFEEQLTQQKQYYENKLQQTAMKQQQVIVKLMNDLYGQKEQQEKQQREQSQLKQILRQESQLSIKKADSSPRKQPQESPERQPIESPIVRQKSSSLQAIQPIPIVVAKPEQQNCSMF